MILKWFAELSGCNRYYGAFAGVRLLHGKFASPITFDEDWMDVGTGRISVTHERTLPCYRVTGCGCGAGMFRPFQQPRNLLPIYPRVQKKLVSRLPPGNFTVVYGVNHDLYAKTI